MKYLILISILFTIWPNTLAQDETPRDFFEDGDFFFAREEYEEAAYLYSQLLKSEPENHNGHYKLGMAYLNMEGEEHRAIDHFLKATENISLKYRKNYYPEKRAPHHTWFFLGNAYRITNRLQEALEAYEKFRSVNNFEKLYNARITDEEIKAVGRAKIIQDAPLDLYSFCFEEPLNTGGTEYKAVMSSNEKVMVWMNSQKFYEAILMSVKQDGKWVAPINITPQLGSDGNMYPTGLSADGTELLLVKEGEVDNDIYYSTYDGKLWKPAEPLHGEVNSNFNEDHASFSPDNSRIIFSSDRRGSVGGLDIWISTKLEDGTWGVPQNAGREINTEFDETSAYLSPDGKKIIFSSKGHFNMGGYDVFHSQIDEEGNFGFAYNIGFPINSSRDNTFYVPLKDGNTGIYSMRHEDGVGDKDIWYLEIIPAEETVAKALTRLSEENFTITVTDKESGERITLEYDAIRDSITIRSSSGKAYGVVYSRENNDR
ncbi:MAG: tetratricopeptide repeat protein [Bacteroidales bacterium]